MIGCYHTAEEIFGFLCFHQLECLLIAFFCYRLGSMFWIGVTSGLIPTSKHEKAIIDHEYIFYLPFVHAFCSSDSFHRDFSPFFLRHDQDFIWGDDLRADLKVISSFNDNMTDDEKKYYAINFGNYPPPIPESITNILWQKHMKDLIWRIALMGLQFAPNE